MRTAIGIDLGGTQVKGVLVDEAGAVLARELRATSDSPEPRAWLEPVRALLHTLGAGQPFGVSAPGLPALDGRSVASMPGRLPGIEGFDWTREFQHSSRVPVMNDAQAALFAEAWIGAARGLRDVILLTLGTGVGGAILVDGRPLRGHRGIAGHFGHTCLDPDGPPSVAGMPGALECFVGNCTVRERTGGRFETTHALIDAFRAGDAAAREFWLRSVQALACAIGSFANILDPEAVIIGGGIAQAGDALFTPLREELAKVEWRPTGIGIKVLPAALGEWAGAIGAARLTLESSAK